MPSLIGADPVVLEKRVENLKRLQTERGTDGRTDGQTHI